MLKVTQIYPTTHQVILSQLRIFNNHTRLKPVSMKLKSKHCQVHIVRYGWPGLSLAVIRPHIHSNVQTNVKFVKKELLTPSRLYNIRKN